MFNLSHKIDISQNGKSAHPPTRPLHTLFFSYNISDYFSLTPTHHCTEGCMGGQASLEFDLTFSDVWLHKLVKAY